MSCYSHLRYRECQNMLHRTVSYGIRQVLLEFAVNILRSLLLLKSMCVVNLSSITFQVLGTIGTMYVHNHKTNPPLKSILYTMSYSWKGEWTFSLCSSLHTVYFQRIFLWLSVVEFFCLVGCCLGVGSFMCLLFGGFFLGVILVEGGGLGRGINFHNYFFK